MDVTEHPPVEQDDPVPEVLMTKSVEAENKTTTDTPGYTLFFALTPAVLRQLLPAAEQMVKARSSEDLSLQKRK